MLRWSFLMLASAAGLAAQIRWTCDAKDGKFTMTPCSTCQKFYCWDGQIFSEEPGYTPPPSYVLSYWEEAHRRSQQIRADVDRKGKELGEQVQKASQETVRLNQERNQAHKEYMDDLNRRINESHSSQGAPHTGMGATNQRAVPKDIVVAASGPDTSGRSIPPSSRVRASEVAVPRDLVVAATVPSTSAASIPPCSRAKASEVKVGMDRPAVEGLLGKPHSAISIPEEGGLMESLSYRLEDHGTFRVRILGGKVVSVDISE